MPIASGSDVRVAYVAETSFGVTPSTPTFKVMRVTSTGLRSEKATATSDEIRQDRNVIDEMLVGRDASARFPFEMSHASFDDMIEAALMGTWASDVVANGTARRSFTFEETRELGATDSYSRVRGCMVDTLSLSITAREKITGQIGLMGVQETMATAIVSGATYTAANSEPVMTASAHVGSISVGALSAKVWSLSFEVNNGLRRRPVVGSLYSEEFGYGMANVTGTLEAYFESNALYSAMLNHESVAIAATFGVDANKKYTISLPKAILGNGEIRGANNTSDIMVSIPFRAVLSSGRSIEITRAVA